MDLFKNLPFLSLGRKEALQCNYRAITLNCILKKEFCSLEMLKYQWFWFLFKFGAFVSSCFFFW